MKYPFQSPFHFAQLYHMLNSQYYLHRNRGRIIRSGQAPPHSERTSCVRMITPRHPVRQSHAKPRLLLKSDIRPPIIYASAPNFWDLSHRHHDSSQFRSGLCKSLAANALWLLENSHRNIEPFAKFRCLRTGKEDLSHRDDSSSKIIRTSILDNSK